MTISTTSQLSLKAAVTPADSWGASTYDIGPNGEAITIPTDADLVTSITVTTTSGIGKVYEPDIHAFDTTAYTDPDGGVVAMATIYALVLQNTHATLTATYAATAMGTVGPGGDLQPLAYAVHHWPAGLALGATSLLTITGVSGTPTVKILCIGVAT